MKSCLPVAIGLGLLGGCYGGPESGMGFRLPDGDADRGRAAFIDLQCHSCHTVRNLELPAPDTVEMAVVLGRDVSRVQTYGELVTSVINPSHRLAPHYPQSEVTVDGESRMATAHLNDVITVQQLIDLVAFLQPLY
ncbi:MAG TPA: cytochrome C, partial [Woeseiaceae bacterium]|nr:cytochrome C [Woeseiaceae bacterium]